MTHLSLFTGIGGLDLAAEWAGFETVGQCEWADYPTAVLEKHWPDVPRWRDIRELTAESFYERTGLRTVDIISGGFPCQPFSVAGKHGGEEDDRYLWPEMFRVIQELEPTWVIGENVYGIINLALDSVLSDLEGEGYETQTLVLPACAVNAWHRRDRVCIVAYHPRERNGFDRTSANAPETCGEGLHNSRRTKTDDPRKWRENKSDMGRMVSRLCERVDWPDSHTESECCKNSLEQEIYRGGVPEEIRRADRDFPGRNYWENEPGVGRVADGIPHRVDRIRCLGNAVVPQQFYPIFKAIAEIEKAMTEAEE